MDITWGICKYVMTNINWLLWVCLKIAFARNFTYSKFKVFVGVWLYGDFQATKASKITSITFVYYYSNALLCSCSLLLLVFRFVFVWVNSVISPCDHSIYLSREWEIYHSKSYCYWTVPGVFNDKGYKSLFEYFIVY